jgi:dihydrofolate synthase/folylpolyglutamate synthase
VSAPGPPAWSPADAERYLRSLDLFGMRFGLDRIRRLMTVLGLPQERFASIHVVGTNGKSSTVRMIAAILERHGLRTGAYLSPHLFAYTERIRVAERDLPAQEFAHALARAVWAAERVNRTLAEDDRVTQFELLTAAAFSQLAERGVEVAVVEAGLGGRYDATNVIDSRVQALTTVGLEHTRWLGPTVRDIATEKLAVVRPGSTLVLGSELDPEVRALARESAADLGTRVVVAPDPDAPGGPGATAAVLGARGAFQRRNFALARAAAAAFLQSAGAPLEEDAVRAAAAATVVPGRFQLVAADPPTVVDGAHNTDGVRALVESLPELLAGRPLVTVLGILDDKDAAGMLRTLLPLCAHAVFTRPQNARALSPATLQSLARQLGFTDAVTEPRPSRALAAGRSWAQAHGGVLLVSGSIYLISDALRGTVSTPSLEGVG